MNQRLKPLVSECFISNKNQFKLKDLTIGKESKAIFQFALPMLIGNVFMQLYNIVDSIIVGNYIGKEALSAVGASFPVYFALISLVIGIASGSAIVISQYFGAKDYEKVQKGVDTMFILLIASTVVISFIGIVFVEDIFRLIKLPEELMADAKTYMVITLLGLFAAFGYNGIASIYRSLGDSKTPLYFLIISTITNILLDLLFVLQFGMGVEGVAIATIISEIGAFASGIIYLNRTHKVIKINLFKLKFDKEIFLKSTKIGLPAGFQQLFVALGMTALFAVVNQFGTNVIAAYSVALRIDSFAIMPAMNFGQALTAFVGQNIGAGKIHRVKNGLKSTILMSSSISLSISIIVIFAGGYLMALFTPDKEVIRLGHEYLMIVGSFYIIFAVMFSYTGVFRGAGDTIIPMFITLFSLWLIRIPLSYYLSADFAQNGIWYSIPLAWGFGLTASLIYYFSGRWKNKAVVSVNN